MFPCYTFGSKLSNMSVIYLVLILADAQAIRSIRLIDEDDSWLNHDDPPHSYATNMWWRLANYTVKTSDMNVLLLVILVVLMFQIMMWMDI